MTALTDKATDSPDEKAGKGGSNAVVAPVKQSQRQSPILPAEIILEILKLLAQQGQEHSQRALHISKALYTGLENDYHFKIYWGNMKEFPEHPQGSTKKVHTYDNRLERERK